MKQRGRLTKQFICNYIVIMKANLIKIGNSRGLRLPKPVIEQCGLGTEVELVVRGKKLVIHGAARPRERWAAEFKKMSARGDDRRAGGGSLQQNAWDESEWEWK